MTEFTQQIHIGNLLAPKQNRRLQSKLVVPPIAMAMSLKLLEPLFFICTADTIMALSYIKSFDQYLVEKAEGVSLCALSRTMHIIWTAPTSEIANIG